MLATWPGTLTLAIALSAQSGTISEVLPDTPQGRHVSAYIEAFNVGEAAFVAMYEAATIPEMAAQTPPARRVELYKQLVRELGTIKVEKVIASSPKQEEERAKAARQEAGRALEQHRSEHGC